MVNLGHHLEVTVSHLTCSRSPGNVPTGPQLLFECSAWSTCKALNLLSQRGFHAVVLSGSLLRSARVKKSTPVFTSVNPLTFPTHCSCFSSCFHLQQHSISDSPAFKPTRSPYPYLISSWWSPQYFYHQTLHLSFVQRCEEKSLGRMIPASETIAHLLAMVPSFPARIYHVYWSILREGERASRQARQVCPVLSTWHFQAYLETYWLLLLGKRCETAVCGGYLSAQGVMRVSSSEILHCVCLSLTCNVASLLKTLSMRWALRRDLKWPSCLNIFFCPHRNSSPVDETNKITWLVSDFTACLVFMQSAYVCLLIQKQAALAEDVIWAD